MAMFCPECGKPLAPAVPKAPEASASPDAEIPDPAAISTTEPVESSKSPRAGLPVKTAVVPQTAKADTVCRRNQPGRLTEPGDRPGTGERTREKFHRASSVARGALEENVKRVEKIHDFSTTMLEEAHYDPSLRFVLVALGLFIVFVVLLILSKVMG
jgi:hypothetical protein